MLVVLAWLLAAGHPGMFLLLGLWSASLGAWAQAVGEGRVRIEGRR